MFDVKLFSLPKHFELGPEASEAVKGLRNMKHDLNSENPNKHQFEFKINEETFKYAALYGGFTAAGLMVLRVGLEKRGFKFNPLQHIGGKPVPL